MADELAVSEKFLQPFYKVHLGELGGAGVVRCEKEAWKLVSGLAVRMVWVQVWNEMLLFR